MICFESNSKQDLYPEESSICENFRSTKRIAEFTRGRIAAKKALAEIGILNFPVLKAYEGQPLWPKGVNGSITHSGEFAAAAVSKKIKQIGIDLESKTKERNAKIFSRICTKQEQLWVKDSAINGLKIFSAKEAIYKAFFALDKLTFTDVELKYSDDFFTCTLTKTVNEQYQVGTVFKLQQYEDKAYIFSLCLL